MGTTCDNPAYAPGGRLHWIAKARKRPKVRAQKLMLTMPLHFPGRESSGELVFPADIGPEDFPVLDALVAYLRAVVKANGKP